MNPIRVHKTVHCEGLSCPMPVLRTKQAMDTIQPGEILEVIATDRGSVADLKGWAQRTGHQYLGLREEGGKYHHYVRKAVPEEERPENRYPHVVAIDELPERLKQDQALVIDVREPAEYAFGHIPQAVNIPLGDLEGRIAELDADVTYYVVCRSGHRSDQACQMLAERGFKQVYNVVPGMNAWSGPIETSF